MLIDLDLAKVRDSSPSGARYQTGTMQFMAVEVLHKVDHTCPVAREINIILIFFSMVILKRPSMYANGIRSPDTIHHSSTNST